jgi:hypothetical protein
MLAVPAPAGPGGNQLRESGADIECADPGDRSANELAAGPPVHGGTASKSAFWSQNVDQGMMTSRKPTSKK